MEGLELGSGVRCPLLKSCHCPTRGRIWSQVVGAEVLRVRPKLVLFYEPCPSLQAGGPGARGALQGGPCQLQRSELSPMCCPCTHQQLLPLLCLDKALSAGKVHLSLSSAVKGFCLFVCFFPFPFPISSTECCNLSSGNLNIYKVSLTCGCLLKSALSRFTLSAAKKDWGQFIDSCWFNSPYTKNYLPITWYTQVGETPLKSTGL